MFMSYLQPLEMKMQVILQSENIYAGHKHVTNFFGSLNMYEVRKELLSYVKN